MKYELTKQFLSKMIRRTFVTVFVIFIISTIIHSLEPIIANELALTQMQNDNAMYIIVSVYNRLKIVYSIAVTGIILRFMYTIGRDTYKFAKTINNSANIVNGTNEKEN